MRALAYWHWLQQPMKQLTRQLANGLIWATAIVLLFAWFSPSHLREVRLGKQLLNREHRHAGVPLNDMRRYGVLSVQEILVGKSNVGTAMIALTLGRNRHPQTVCPGR